MNWMIKDLIVILTEKSLAIDESGSRQNYWFVDDVNIVAKGAGPIKVFEETFKDDLMNSPLWQKMYELRQN